MITNLASNDKREWKSSTNKSLAFAVTLPRQFYKPGAWLLLDHVLLCIILISHPCVDGVFMKATVWLGNRISSLFCKVIYWCLYVVNTRVKLFHFNTHIYHCWMNWSCLLLSHRDWQWLFVLNTSIICLAHDKIKTEI